MYLGYGLDELFQKYNILLNGTQRIYTQSLTKRDYVLENTTPYSIVIDNFLEIKIKAWTKVVVGVVKYLQANYPLPLEELYEFRTDWSKAAVFGPEKFLDNCVEVCDGLFVSVNFTALHSLWFIQDILKKYKIDLSTCYLLIHRAPVAEPVEVQNAVREVVKNSFTRYLIDEKKKTEEIAINIVKNFKHINLVLSQITRSYYDFFLFDNPIPLATYKSKLILEYKKYSGWSEKQIEIVKKYLDYYTDFFRQVSKTMKVTKPFFKSIDPDGKIQSFISKK